MSKAFITDLDHTFLRSDLSISDLTRKVWNATAKEATLSVATARSYHKSVTFLKALEINAPMVLLDGALIVSQEQRIIDMKLLDKEIADAVVFEGAKFDLFPFILSLKDTHLNEAFIYPARHNEVQSRLLERYRGDDNLVEHKQVQAMEKNFKIVYMGAEELLRPLSVHMRQVFGDALELKLAPEAYLDSYFLTILHPLADKASGVRRVCDHLGLDPDTLTVFGDNINDLGMFDLAGTAVAVQNAIDEVKAAADIVLPHTNDEDAVARYLSSLKRS